MTKSKKPKTKQAATITSLSRALGLSRQAITRHASKPDAPGLGDVAGWQEFLALHGREGSAQPELRKKIAEERLKLLRAMAEREGIRLAKDREETIAKADVVFALNKAMAHLFNEMDRVFSIELPAALTGLGAADIQKRLLGAVIVFKAGLRAHWSGLLETK